MHDIRHEERISAYLDGQLSERERQEVEELLAASAEARTLLEELRAVRSALQELPRSSVGEDLGAAVLRRAERAMLAGRRIVEAGPLADDEAEPKRRLPGLSWNSWRWAAVAALAAALMLMLNPHRPEPADGPAEVAKGPPPAAEGQMAALDDEADDAEPMIVAEPTQRESNAAAKRRSADFAPEDADAIAPGRVGGRDQGEAGQRPQQFDAEGSFRAQPPAPAAPPLVAGALPDDAANRAKDGRRLERDAASRLAADAQFGAGAAAVDEEELLVVQVDIAWQAVLDGAFDQLLHAQNIMLEEQPSRTEAAALAKADAVEGTRRKQLADAPAERKAPVEDGVSLRAELGEQVHTEVVYVEATAAQIEATLAELNAQRHNYFAVAVEPAPNVARQQPLARYNRVVPMETRQRAVRELQERFAADKLQAQPLQEAPPAQDAPQEKEPKNEAAELTASPKPAADPQFADDNLSKSGAGDAPSLDLKQQADQPPGQPLPDADRARQQVGYGYALRLNLPREAYERNDAAEEPAADGIPRAATSGRGFVQDRLGQQGGVGYVGGVSGQEAQARSELRRSRLEGQPQVELQYADETMRVLFVLRRVEQAQPENAAEAETIQPE